MSGSNRLTRRNRKFLRAYEPGLENKLNVRNDKYARTPLVSDWGAEGYIPSSSDMVDVPQQPVLREDDGQITEQQHVDERDHVTPGTEVSKDDIVSRTEPVTIPRRSARSSKGKTSKFDDYVTGQGVEDI